MLQLRKLRAQALPAKHEQTSAVFLIVTDLLVTCDWLGRLCIRQGEGAVAAVILGYQGA
jgi:hypothetical protein